MYEKLHRFSSTRLKSPTLLRESLFDETDASFESKNVHYWYYPQETVGKSLTLALILRVTDGWLCENLLDESLIEIGAFHWTIDAINSASDELNGVRVNGVVMDTCREPFAMFATSLGRKKLRNAQHGEKMNFESIWALIDSSNEKSLSRYRSVDPRITILNLKPSNRLDQPKNFELRMAVDFSQYDLAIMDLLTAINVSYVAAVYDEDETASLNRMLFLDQEAPRRGICLHQSYAASQMFGNPEKIFKDLTENRVQILVFLTNSRLSQKVIDTLNPLQSGRVEKLIYIGQFAQEEQETNGCLGSINLRQYSGTIEPFWNHFTTLNTSQLNIPFLDKIKYCHSTKNCSTFASQPLTRPANYDETKLINLVNSAWLTTAGWIKLGMDLCPEFSGNVMECEKFVNGAAKLRQEIFDNIKFAKINSIDNADDVVSIADNGRVDATIKMLNLQKDDKNALFYDMV